MNQQYKKLIMVDVNDGSKKGAAQSNKFYEMIWDGGSTFTVNYGRVELTKTTMTYPYSQWNTKYNEKVKKGYKDVTDLVSVEVETTKAPKKTADDLEAIEDRKVKDFLVAMQAYTNGLVSRTYSVKSEKVSIKQIQEAQKTLDDLADLAKAKKKDVTLINTRLVELYTIIPRYMKDVRQEILPHIDLDTRLVQEQDNLDAMGLQVNMNTKQNDTKEDKKQEKLKQTLLDKLGVTMKEIKSNKDVDKYVKQISGQKVKAVFEVQKPKEDTIFDTWLKNQANKTTTVVIHGTRCTSVIPILEQGLKIRPAGNFQFSGKAYGNGNYFSEQCATSLGYTGYDNDQVLLVYEVHTGKVSSNSFHDYSSCKKAGYDSFNGSWLRVAYNESQARIKYIIWLKR